MVITDRADMESVRDSLQFIYEDDINDERDDIDMIQYLMESLTLMIDLWDYNESHESMDDDTCTYYRTQLNKLRTSLMRYGDDECELQEELDAVKDAVAEWLTCI